MDIAALVAWIVTALGGFVLLGRWLQAGGQKPGASALPAPLVFGHFLLAGAGLVLWIIYVVNDSSTLAWIAFADLIVIALLGFTMLTRWVPATRAAIPAGSAARADDHIPLPVVVAHGFVAVCTVVLVLLSALGVGGS